VRAQELLQLMQVQKAEELLGSQQSALGLSYLGQVLRANPSNEVAASRLSQRVSTLSGGNQQKVLLARWAALEPDLFILNEPTRGIDVKTREAIHRWIEEIVQAGRCVLPVSSDTQEMIRLADRCLVFRAGRITSQLKPPRLEEHTLIAALMEG